MCTILFGLLLSQWGSTHCIVHKLLLSWLGLSPNRTSSSLSMTTQKISLSWYQQVISRKLFHYIYKSHRSFRISSIYRTMYFQPHTIMGQELTYLNLKFQVGDYPCLCLCLGFSQITLIRPFLLMILHFSQIGFTDDLTFTLNPPFKKDRFTL